MSTKASVESPLPIAVLISGGGTTLKNLIEKRRAGSLSVDFRLVVSSRNQAGGLAFAQDEKIPTRIVRRRDFASPEAHSQKMFEAIRESGAKLVVMGGYLEHLLIPSDFAKRVLNVHPSLIPSFCGKGMYGLRVHEAALEFGVKISGCTVHWVDNEYDHGPIILQRACEVLDSDTPESLQKRVFALECEALPEAIRRVARA